MCLDCPRCTVVFCAIVEVGNRNLAAQVWGVNTSQKVLQFFVCAGLHCINVAVFGIDLHGKWRGI